MALIRRSATSAAKAGVLAMFTLLGGTGLGRLAAQDTTPPAPVSDSVPAPGRVGDPQVVLSTMHQLNQLEMRLGQWAEEKGATVAIRRFGNRLFRDHRFADGKVTKLAEAENLKLLPADQLPAAPELQPVIEKTEQLQQEEGAAFDSTFLNVVIESHEMATRMLGDALVALPSGDVRDLVSRLLPILEQHLELAREIRGRGSAD